MQIRQLGSRTDWFATKEKGNFSATTTAGNSRAPKAAGGASLTDWRDPVLRQRPSEKLWDRDLMRKRDVWELYTICSYFRVAWPPHAMAEEAKKKKKHQDPGGTNSCCSANSNRKMTLFTLFWLVYPLLMFFFSPMIPENLTYLM